MADLSVVATSTSDQQMRGVRSLVYVNKNVGYFFYIDNAVDFMYKKTTDGGRTWSAAVTIQASETMVAFDVWYDRWTPGDTGTKIHIWYFGTGADDVIHKTLDTQTDTLSAGVTVFNGATAVASRGTFVSGTKARGGNLYCLFNIDAFAETGLYRSTDGGAVWGSRTTPLEANSDQAILFPGNETDNQDIWMLYQDASTDELTLKVHDDSADTNSESSVIGALIEETTDTLGQYAFSGSIRHSDGHLIAALVDAYDSAGASSLEIYDINGTGSITAKTNIATNVDDIYWPSVFIDQTNNYIYVAYVGKSDGSDTIATTAHVYYAYSTDGGANWTKDNIYTASSTDWKRTWTPLMGERFQVFYYDISADTLYTSYDTSLVLVADKRWQVKPYLPVPDNSTSLRRGLVFDAPLHEKGGTTVKDLVHNITGSFGASAPTWVNTPYGRALDFPTADGAYLVTFTTGTNVNTQTNISVELVFKIDSVSGTNTTRIFEKGAAATPRWSVGITTAGKIRFSIGFSTANNAYDITDPIPLGQFHHLVITNTTVGTTTQPNIWLNGIKRSLTQATAGSGTLNSDTTGLYFGNTAGTNRGMDGQIVYARAWNKLLNQSEVLQLYSDPWSIYKTPTMSLGKFPGIVRRIFHIT